MRVSLYFYDSHHRPTRPDAPSTDVYTKVLCHDPSSNLGTVGVRVGKNELVLGAIVFKSIANMVPDVNMSYLMSVIMSTLQGCGESLQDVQLYIYPPTLFEHHLNYTNPKNRFMYYKNFVPQTLGDHVRVSLKV
ncbi:15k virion structural protein [Helicoverpa zea nudivirus 2]|uniref:15k virion structural protein n=1 Tax=Helicoverpa zea nudivirus 2 TaxID=1128424 RepID=G9I0C3_HZNV2|nr:orf97 gene product [Helicoverpa zea nudivirus 2]AEW69646.1 15k virion structural protein [Helicoverpa zea nudivirus 2]